MLLLVLVGVSAIGGKLTRVVARDVKAELADESDTDTQNTSETSNPPDDDALTDSTCPCRFPPSQKRTLPRSA
jgi:hypothetical protein